jgi:nitrogen fixation protein FixH
MQSLFFRAGKPHHKRERQKSFWIPYVFFGMFGVIIAVNGALIYWATASWPGLSSDNHYERGLEYNEVLEAKRQQAALGWSIQADLGQPLDGKADLIVSLTGKTGQPLYADNVTAELRRPAVEGFDSRMQLVSLGEGRYRGEAELPQPGVWDLVLLIERGADQHVSKQRLYVKP